jgi:DNA topoisomerase-3
LLQKVTGKPFVIVSFEKKKGKEYPPRLFDLTSLQVNGNKRFGFSADKTLKLVQTLYEKKVVTYPRVDTTYLPNDIYPKVPGILQQLTNYSQFTSSLLGQQIRKSTKVFDDKKITDHHAIIPTGVQLSLMPDEQKIYDAITRRFIAAFYPDCIVSNNTVIGEVDGVTFKATGKEILEEGWRVLYPKPVKTGRTEDEGKEDGEEGKNEEKLLPNFIKGESGPHKPTLMEKVTQPPKHYTEATLLRGMETAGKKVDDEKLRELMKANGIGRPSTRANIIETLFKRQYIRRNKKQVLATETGVQLIDTIKNELLKSAELTGHWEKKLRGIEEGSHSATLFIQEMKEMVSKLVEEVRLENSVRRIATAVPKYPSAKKKRTASKAPAVPTATIMSEQRCPKCRQGNLLKGKTAYGCSRYKEGCDFRMPFSFLGKKIPEKQLLRLFKMGSTINLKGFKESGQSKEGLLRFSKDHTLVFEEKKTIARKAASKKIVQKKVTPKSDSPACPKCSVGKIVKGKTAYGCSNWRTGCDFRFSFDEIRKRAKGAVLTKELVWGILVG